MVCQNTLSFKNMKNAITLLEREFYLNIVSCIVAIIHFTLLIFQKSPLMPIFQLLFSHALKLVFPFSSTLR